jgi:hypothetical protein
MMIGVVFGREYNGVVYFALEPYHCDPLYKQMLHIQYPDAVFDDKAGTITLTAQSNQATPENVGK